MNLCPCLLQELADWNPARRKLTPISGGATFSLRDISKSLEAIKATPVMVPTQRAFEVGLSAICRGDGDGGDGLDGLVTVAGTEREVSLLPLLPSSTALPCFCSTRARPLCASRAPCVQAPSMYVAPCVRPYTDW